MDNASVLQERIDRLEEQVNRLQQAQALSGLGIWQFDIKKDEVIWSDEVYRIYELDPSVPAPKLEEILHYASEEERQFVENKIYKAILKGEAYKVDCSIITNSGKIKHVHAIGQPYYNVAKELTHLFGTIVDITERKKVEKNLRFSHFTIESISDGIFWIDQETRFIRVNQAAGKNLGYDLATLQGMTAADINPDFDLELSQIYWEETKEKGHLTFRTEHTRKNGQRFPVEITNNIFEFEGEEFRCSIVRDITEQVKKEKAIEQALEEVKNLKDQLTEENIYLRQEIQLSHNFEAIIYQSKAYERVLKKVEQVAKTEATVLITGESGTGKELIARAVHNLSGRSNRPLVKVNCAALPVNIIESELFGHERGAFTGAISKKIGRFELAHQGSIFLDEIGELPIEVQAKLLRVLQEGEFERLGSSRTIKVDVRIIAATNRDLARAIGDGDFRNDLYYRLNVFPIECLPLRERKEDIPILVRHFVDKFAPKAGKNIETIAPKVLKALEAYDWPGNVRELENIIERAVIISTSNNLEIGDWLPKPEKAVNKVFLSMEEMERKHILDALAQTNGRVSGTKGAALILGMNAKTLDSRMRKLGIKRVQKFDI